MPRFAANLSWVLQEIPILDRFAAARGLGFEAAEFGLSLGGVNLGRIHRLEGDALHPPLYSK